MYRLGYSTSKQNSPVWLASIESKWLAFAPTNWFVFTGASFALFASGGGEPWNPYGQDVGFSQSSEEYYEENIPDYDVW